MRTHWLVRKQALALVLGISIQGVFMGITAQNRIDILHPAEVRTDRNILHRAFVNVRSLGFIPGTSILFPRDISRRRCQIDIHVGAVEFADILIHEITLSECLQGSSIGESMP